MEDKVTKLAVSSAADIALDRMLTQVNSGFTAGRLKKAELACWLIVHFEKNGFEGSIEDLRRAFFDDTAYLEFVVRELKKTKRSGSKKPEVASLLSPLMSRLGPNKSAALVEPTDSLSNSTPSTGGKKCP